ncbi:hypothetical protein AQJ58_19240 [Streptomyces sp. DSM 15324]|nr:hypothetical protein AQJ58_19240 [Streptomyces sp. DSM 15324]
MATSCRPRCPRAVATPPDPRAVREYAERHERAALVAKHFHAAQQWDYESWQQRRVEDKQGGA